MAPPDRKQALKSILFGGILPVVAFTVVEEVYGTLAGLVAGMVFGVGEIAVEWIKNRRVDGITWAGNGLLLVMGGISLVTKEGIWFKLQPAIIEAVTGVGLLGSVVAGKPFLVLMGRKQGLFDRMRPEVQPVMTGVLTGFTVRVAIFFLLHAALATWAAWSWSTRAWAILKGVGFTASLFAYFGAEAVLMRRRLGRAVAGLVEVQPEQK